MTNITVNLEDLETLIFAAGSVKAIEAAMDTRKRDPFVPPQNKITESINRLASEARSARRSKETYATAWDGPLTAEEEKWLDDVCKNYDPADRERRMIVVTADELYGRAGTFRHGPIHNLVNKGMVAIGTAAFAVIWSGADQPEFWPDPFRFYVMPTPRGLGKWQELKSAQPSLTP